MNKKEKITVQGTEITVISEKNNDYICLTDMVKGQEGEDHIRNWMRNRNTLEFLGAWEMLHNPAFKGVEFDTFLHEAGANRFNMTPRKWIETYREIYSCGRFIKRKSRKFIAKNYLRKKSYNYE